MDLDLLRIDLDKRFRFQAVRQIKERLCYLNDIGVFYSDLIKKVELIKKRTYGVKIYLKQPVKSESLIIILQLLIGSDYQKEANTLLNHCKLNMQYSNRLFNCKRYKKGKILIAEKIDVTNDIITFIESPKRREFKT